MKNLLLTATRYNEGKTILALGLIHALAKKGKKVAYFKPIGHGSQENPDGREDPDSVLLKSIGMPGTVNEISPVVLQGFPSDWATREGHGAVLARIQKSFQRISEGRDLTIIEATGNAAAGAAFGLSNAYLARILDARVILMASGGVGQPTDEIILNKSYFERTGIEVAGVVINKTFPHETERLNTFMKRVLDTLNLKLLGALPYDPELSRPTLRNLVEEFHGTVLNGEKSLDARVGRFVFGAMSAARAPEQFKGRVTLICPIDREDMLQAAINTARARAKTFKLAGVVFAGLGRPEERLVQIIKKTPLPAMHMEIDAYSLAFLIHSTRYKVAATDKDRISRAVELISKHVDVDTILERLQA